MPIIRTSRPYLCYYRFWCAMPCLLVVGGQVQNSRLCVQDEGCSSTAVELHPSSRTHSRLPCCSSVELGLECVWNVMAHAQKQDFVFRRNGLAHLNRLGCQFSRLLAAEVCESAIVILDTPCSELVWRVLATHSIRQFPLHFPSRASPCAITFQLDSTKRRWRAATLVGGSLSVHRINRARKSTEVSKSFVTWIEVIMMVHQRVLRVLVR